MYNQYMLSLATSRKAAKFMYNLDTRKYFGSSYEILMVVLGV